MAQLLTPFGDDKRNFGASGRTCCCLCESHFIFYHGDPLPMLSDYMFPDSAPGVIDHPQPELRGIADLNTLAPPRMPIHFPLFNISDVCMRIFSF